mgnify:CR=1 FL=1
MEGQRANASDIARHGARRYNLQQIPSNSHSGRNTDQWSVEEVLNWLQNYGVAQESIVELSQIFKQQEIHGCQLQLLNDAMLKEMGITKMGVRIAILAAIESRTGANS